MNNTRRVIDPIHNRIGGIMLDLVIARENLAMSDGIIRELYKECDAYAECVNEDDNYSTEDIGDALADIASAFPTLAGIIGDAHERLGYIS